MGYWAHEILISWKTPSLSTSPVLCGPPHGVPPARPFLLLKRSRLPLSVFLTNTPYLCVGGPPCSSSYSKPITSEVAFVSGVFSEFMFWNTCLASTACPLCDGCSMGPALAPSFEIRRLTPKQAASGGQDFDSHVLGSHTCKLETGVIHSHMTVEAENAVYFI